MVVRIYRFCFFIRIVGLTVFCFLLQSLHALSTVASLSVLKKIDQKSVLLFSLAPSSRELPHGNLDEEHFVQMLDLLRKEEKLHAGYHMLIQVQSSPEKAHQAAQLHKRDLTDLFYQFPNFSYSSFINIEVSKVLRGALKIFSCDDPRYLSRHFIGTLRETKESTEYRESSKICYDCDLDMITLEKLLKDITNHVSILESLIRQWKNGRKDLSYFGNGVADEIERYIQAIKDNQTKVAELFSRVLLYNDETFLEFAERLWLVTMESITHVPKNQDEALSMAQVREHNAAQQLEIKNLFTTISNLLNEAVLLKTIASLQERVPLQKIIIIAQQSLTAPICKLLLSKGFALEEDYYRTSENSNGKAIMKNRLSLSNPTQSAENSAAVCIIQ